MVHYASSDAHLLCCWLQTLSNAWQFFVPGLTAAAAAAASDKARLSNVMSTIGRSQITSQQQLLVSLGASLRKAVAAGHTGPPHTILKATAVLGQCCMYMESMMEALMVHTEDAFDAIHSGVALKEVDPAMMVQWMGALGEAASQDLHKLLKASRKGIDIGSSKITWEFTEDALQVVSADLALSCAWGLVNTAQRFLYLFAIDPFLSAAQKKVAVPSDAGLDPADLPLLPQGPWFWFDLHVIGRDVLVVCLLIESLLTFHIIP